LNALGLVSVVSFLLSIIYVISTTAFNAIISLQTISLSVSYIPPFLFFMLRKVRGEHIPYGPFKLGRYGIATNVLALAYLLYVVIWMPFPTMLPVTGSNMNYAALVDWTFSGHKRFKVPVAQNWTM
jgi:choline transport protein